MALASERRPDAASTNPATTPAPTLAMPAQAKFGVWVGCFGWLIGFVLVATEFVPQLWLELLGGVAVSAAVAWSTQRLMLPRPAPVRVWSVVASAVGVLWSYYALAMMPAVRQLPDLVERLASLSSVVEVPFWPGALLFAGGVIGLVLTRARRPAAAA